MIFYNGEEVPQHGVLPVTSTQFDSTTIPAHVSAQAALATITKISNNHISYSSAMESSGHVKPNEIVFDPHDGADYVDYSPDYGYWDASGGIDYTGSNANSDGPTPAKTDVPSTTHISGTDQKEDGSSVNVYFRSGTADGKPSDNAVTYQLAQVTHDILTAAPDIGSVNVSATTNGVHDTYSDHYTGNAVDISEVNGQAVSSAAGKNLALELEAQALADPNTRYVEGPGGNWARTDSGAQWVRSADLPTMNNHVHWSSFRD